jgi:hypothetical protein
VKFADFERWRAWKQGDDRRRGPHHRPENASSAAEDLQIVSVLLPVSGHGRLEPQVARLMVLNWAALTNISMSSSFSRRATSAIYGNQISEFSI